MALGKRVAACATERLACTRSFTNKGSGRLQIALKALLSKPTCQGSQKPVPAYLLNQYTLPLSRYVFNRCSSTFLRQNMILSMPISR